MLQSLTLADVRDVLTEFLGSIGDEGDQAEAERERNRVKRMLTVLGFDGPIETTAIAETAKAAPAGLDSRGTPSFWLSLIQMPLDFFFSESFVGGAFPWILFRNGPLKSCSILLALAATHRSLCMQCLQYRMSISMDQ